MPNGINTDTAPLYAIRQALVEFKDNTDSVYARINGVFQYIDEQLMIVGRRRLAEIEEHQRKGTDDGRTDSFACDTCGGRIMLKVMGDSTKCRESGCNGTIHRVYRDRTYDSVQRNRDMEELNELRKLMQEYRNEKEEFLNELKNFIGSNDAANAINIVSKSIMKLEEYLGLSISPDSSNDAQMVNNGGSSSANEVKKKNNDIKAIAGWVGKINPNYNNPFMPIRNPYRVNCGSCAFAVMERLNGDGEAVASKTNIGTDIAMEQATGKTCQYMSVQEIEQHLLSQGAGAHLIVGINREPTPEGVNRAGHWFNAYYDGDKIYTVDGQSGNIYDWPHDYRHVSEWCALI